MTAPAADYVRPEGVRDSDVLREAAATATVHVLRYGFPLCQFTDAVPADWPAGNVWTDRFDVGSITCAECAAHAAILREAAAADARVLREQEPYDLLICAAGDEIRIVLQMARELEANGDVPSLVWHRDAQGEITAVKLVGHVSAETKARMA